MSSNTKTAILAAVSVLAAVALIFVGIVLTAAVPELDTMAQRLLGRDTPSESGGEGTLDSVGFDLQREILERLEATYYQAVDEDTLALSAIDGMLAALDDPYTVYYDPDEYAELIEETTGEYSGVGMVLMLNDRLVTVVSVFEGSPAAQADIQSGDIILAVQGTPTTGRTLDEVVADIRGEEGSEVMLEMYRPVLSSTTTSTTLESAHSEEDVAAETPAESVTIDLAALPPEGVTKEYTLVRRSIVIPTTKTEIIEDEGEKVAHVILYTFNNQNASQELRAAIESAISNDQVDVIILDLRGNGGGLLDEAVKVASIFINSGVIVSTEGLHSREEELRATGGAIQDIPLYVLVDKYSASASEIVAGALQDYSRAVLVGETTFGKGLVQSIEPLSNGGAIKVTTAVYLTPRGRDINDTGVAPDVVAPDDPATKDIDETLEKTLDLIVAGR